MNKNFTIKTGQTQEWSLVIRKVATLFTLFFLTQTLVQANAFLDVTVTSTDASCGGGNDGTATALPTDGWAPFTYQWSNGGTTQTIDGLAPGTYSVTVIDVDGAIASGSTVVGQSGGLNLFLSASYETCVGSADGTASVNVSGGVEPISYSWSTGETFVVASGLSAGIYTVTVTDATGCSAEGTVTVELSPEGIWLMPTATNTDCGLATGTAYAGVMTGVPPYSFLWSDGQTTETATGLTAGNYSVTVTDSNGCTNSESVTVDSNSDLDISVNGADAQCGLTNGSATVSVNGGTAPFTYAWTNGANTATINNLGAGTYGVTVTDVDGCSNAGSVTIDADGDVSVSVTGTDANCNNADGSATASASGGTPPYSYAWSNGGTTATISGLAAGTYDVTVTDANGCDANGSTTIGGSTVDGGFIITTDETHLCVGDGTADIINVDLSGNIGANSTWLITTPGLEILGLFDSPPFDFENAPPGICVIWHLSYEGTITGLDVGANAADLAGCFDLSNSIEVLRQNCCDLDGGDLSTNSNTTICAGDGVDDLIDVNLIGSSAGVNQKWVITDQAGNILGLPTAPPFNLEGAGAGVCLIWSISFEDGLTGLDLDANVADLDGCFALSNQSIAVTRYLAPTISLDGIGVSCNSASDGSITTSIIDGTAPFTYLWSNGATSANIDGLEAGTYSVIVTDDNGCSDEGSVTIGGLIVDGGFINTTDETNLCVGDGTDDIINVALSGNLGNNSKWLITTPGLEILDLSDAPSFNFENAPPGICVIWHLSYDGTITGLDVGANAADLVGCYDLSNSIEVIRENCCDLDGGDLSTNSNTTICAGDGVDDFINVNLSGASAGVYQKWVITDQAGNILGLPTAPPFNLEGAGAGVCLIWSISFEDGLTGLDLNANVADLDGCFALSNQSIAVTRYLAPTISLDGTDVSCNGGSDGLISISITDGTAPFTYLWSNGATTAMATGLSAGTYSVTVTDANGCSDEGSATISEPTAIALTFDGGDENCIGSADGFAVVSASGGTAPYTYLWSNGATTATATDLSAGTYGVTVTDANGCTAANASAVTIISNGITSCSASITSSYFEGVDISTFGGSDGSAAVSVFGGTAPLSYLWSDGQTGASANGLAAGTYTVEITDANGCNCSAEVTLTDPSKIGDFVWEDDNRNGIQDGGEAGISGVAVSLTGTTDGGASVTRSTSTDGNGAYSFDGLLPGEYKVTFDGGTYKTSPKGNGGDASLDSDVNEDTGMTDYFTLGEAECNNDIDAGFYECVNIGDRVFYDQNRDGIQQPWEAGVADVFVRLRDLGPDGVYCTDDDGILDGVVTNNFGNYLFECVEPGQYYIEFGVNTDDYFITDMDQGGDDELDSDADPHTGKTPVFTVTEGQADDLSYDAGIYLICEDFNHGGEIGYSQEVCLGEAADPIVSVELPGGGYGDTEFLWLKSTIGGSLTNGSWVEILNNDSPTYDPGFLNTTTHFIRCARRENCDAFIAESNPVTITVNTCGNNGIIQDLSADVMASSRIALHWSTAPENGLYRYHIERSADAVDFDALGSIEGLGNQQSMNRYEFMDETPRIGRNIYRVLRENLSTGELMYSNNVEAMFNPSEGRMFVYPNPTRGELFVESIYNMNGNATLELYSATGQLLEVVQVNEQEGRASFNFSAYASGSYYVKVIFQDKDDIEVIRIIKE